MKPDEIDYDNLTFSFTETKSMYVSKCKLGEDWKKGQLIPFNDIKISPAATILNYGQGLFEGMKAYKDQQGKIRLFRPDCNMERLNKSMERLYLPQFEPDALISCIKELVKLDEQWIPEGDGFSMYLRPTAVALDPFLGLQMANTCKIFVFSSPVGPYYAEGFKPIKLYADDKNVRAWPGGVGASKVGGNYGPTISPQMSAHEHGCSQVLWLYPTADGDHNVTEVGAMNVFFVIKKADGTATELITAPLDGTILPGVTRRSILELARDSGKFTVSERDLGMKEILAAKKEGRLLEAFGAGTAAVVAPIKTIVFKDENIDLPTGEVIGPVAQEMWDAILDIQYGRIEHPWSVIVN